MIRMSLSKPDAVVDPIGRDYKSPCIGCEREREDKELCVEHCAVRDLWLRKQGYLQPYEERPIRKRESKMSLTAERENKEKKKPAGSALKSPRVCKTEGCNEEARPNGYCPACFGKMGGQAFARKAAMKKQKQALSEAGSVVSVDFRGYEKLLDQLSKLAQEEVRSISQQIVFLLKQSVQKSA
jgi:hypothetical protein